MVDLVRHEFMGPGHPGIISGRPQRPQSPYSEPSTCVLGRTHTAKIWYGLDKSPQKSAHSQACFLSISRNIFCAQPAYIWRCWPGKPRLATGSGVVHSMPPNYTTGTEQYLVLAGNTNRSQLKSANLQSCLHARLLRKWIPRSGAGCHCNWLNSAGLLTVAGCALPSVSCNRIPALRSSCSYQRTHMCCSHSLSKFPRINRDSLVTKARWYPPPRTNQSIPLSG